MADSLDQFVISMIFDNAKTQESANKINAIVTDLSKKAVTALSAIAGFDFFKNSVKQFTDVASKMGYFAQQMGVSVENLNAWEQAVQRTGGTAEDFDNTLKNLHDNLQNIALTGIGQGAKAFYYLGTSLRGANGKLKDTTQLLIDLSGRLSKMSTAKQQFLARQLGIDPATLRILVQGKDATQALVNRMKMLGVITEQQTKDAQRYRNALLDLNQVWTNIKYNIIDFILPGLEKLTDWFTRALLWMRQHKQFMLDFFEALAVVIGITMVRALARLAVATLTNPFVLMLASIVALSGGIALLVEDWQVYERGGKSALATTWKWLDKNIEILKNYRKLWADFTNISFGKQKDPFSFISVGKSTELTNFIQKVKSLFTQFDNWIIKLGKDIKDNLVDIWDAVVNAMNTAWDSIKDKFGWIKDFFQYMATVFLGNNGELQNGNQSSGESAINWKVPPISSADAIQSRITNNSSNRTQNNSNSTNIGTVHVNTGASAESVTKALGGMSRNPNYANSAYAFDTGRGL
jgi:DNA-binding transcriptional regulator YiaG